MKKLNFTPLTDQCLQVFASECDANSLFMKKKLFKLFWSLIMQIHQCNNMIG